MQMTEQEFKDLMAHFYFLGDKIDPVYKRETDKVIAIRSLRTLRKSISSMSRNGFNEPETSIKGTRIVPLFLLCQNYTRR